ncbi:MAG: ArnT family glycosyltransferase [Candidatus Anammoxibacter sp.]
MYKLVKDKYFWILLLLSCTIRVYAWHLTPIIGRDGLDFINIAKLFTEGSFRVGLEHPFHPLYPLLISLGSICGLGFEHSGRTVSFILSIFTVIALFTIGKKMFNQTVGFIAAFLLAIHPYATRLSVDVMSESTYLFFYLTGFGLGYFAINRQKLHLFFLTGIVSSLAYLTRPEGISVMLITGLWISIQLIKTLFASRSTNSKLQDNTESIIPIQKSIKSIFVLLIGFFIFSVPYVLYIKSETGAWTLTKKKQLSHVTRLGAMNSQNTISDADLQALVKTYRHSTPAFDNNMTFTIPLSKPKPEKLDQPKHVSQRSYLNSFFKLATQYMDSLHYPLLIFLIIGIVNIIIKPQYGSQNRYIIAYIALFIFILLLLQKTIGYVSYRHLINIVLVTLFWTAIGIECSYYWIIDKCLGSMGQRAGGRAKHETSISQPATRNSTIVSSKSFIIFLCLIAALILPKTLKTHRKDKVIRKEAGLWLRDHHHGNMTILTDRLIISLYANANGIELPKMILNYERDRLVKNRLDYREIVEFARSVKADYIVATESMEEISPGFFTNVSNNDLEKLIEFDRKNKRIVVYEVKKHLDDNILDEWSIKHQVKP